MSAALKKSPQVRFKENAMEFSLLVGDLVTDAHKYGLPINTTPAALMIASNVVKGTDADSLMTNYILKSITHWPMIKEKNAKFFCNEGMVIFEGLPASNIKDFTFLFEANVYIPLKAVSASGSGTSGSASASKESFEEDSSFEVGKELYLELSKRKPTSEERTVVEKDEEGKNVLAKGTQFVHHANRIFWVRPLLQSHMYETIWTFFHGSCKQAISYIHFKREPDPVTKKYRKEFLSVVNGERVSVAKNRELFEMTEFC
jgi:hypothetical protein